VFAEQQSAKVVTAEPQNVEGHIAGRLFAPEKINEDRTAGLIDRYHLAVDDGLVDVERGRRLVGERLETAQDVALARDEAATALLEIEEAPKAVVLELKKTVGVVERLLSPGW